MNKFPWTDSQRAVMCVTLAGAVVASCLRYGPAVTKAVTPSPRATNIERRPRFAVAAPCMYDLDVYPAPILLPRLVYPPPVVSYSPPVYQPRRVVPTARVYPPPFVFLPPTIRRAWITYPLLIHIRENNQNKKSWIPRLLQKISLGKRISCFLFCGRIFNLR